MELTQLPSGGQLGNDSGAAAPDKETPARDVSKPAAAEAIASPRVIDLGGWWTDRQQNEQHQYKWHGAEINLTAAVHCCRHVNTWSNANLCNGLPECVPVIAERRTWNVLEL